MLGAIASHYVGAGGGGTYAAEVLADSPLAYWRMEETSGTTMADSSDNGRGGTFTGLPTLNKAGAVDLAVGFAQSKYATVPEAAWARLSSAVTVEAWVKASTNAGGNPVVCRYDNSTSSEASWLLDTSGGASRFIVRSGSTNYIATNGSTSDNDGNWHHIVGVFGSSTALIYRDGAQVGSVAGPATINASTANSFAVVIASREAGAGVDSGAQYFPGDIDEVAIYGSALSAARIAAHYAAR